MVAPDTDGEDSTGLGCALENFAESAEVLRMIDDLPRVYNAPEFEAECYRLYNILKQYYEQPHLLDPHLEAVLGRFVALVRDRTAPLALKHAAFHYMYQIIRVRGYKVIVRYLPHEVTDFQEVLYFLEAQDPQDKETWRSKFVLLLWLSIVVIIPFHMARLDGFAPGDALNADGSKKKTVMERVLNICKTYAFSTDACLEAGAFLTSKFLVRSDVKEVYLGEYLDWACQLHSNIRDEGTIRYGVLAGVAAVLKHGKREDLLPLAGKLLEWVTQQKYEQHNAILVRKYGVKIVQRIGCTYLKPRVVTWRYTQGSRSLAANLAPSGAAAGGLAHTQSAATPPPTSEEDDTDIPQEVEDVVELLLCGLRDDDTVVRWSAAKGVGRVAARLPPTSAADVCDSVLSLFTDSEREAAWHGGCMALAELARRGLLSPPQLGAGVRAVTQALRRDEMRGAGAGGGGRAARDAACHAAWAFARAYDGQALEPHAKLLSNSLLATAVFDREINCRRAASAAYQENVGRHGMFPHGIDVLTAADFQSVGPRVNAYLTVAPLVARYPEYTQGLVDHLVDLKVEHWDCAVRELAAKALHKLTDKIPEYVAKVALPKLVAKTVSIDLNARHGAILAIGEAFYALSLTELPDEGRADVLVPEEVRSAVRGLVPLLYTKHQFRGLGGELMRKACCECMRNLTLAHLAVHGDQVVDEWLNLIEECLSHSVQAIRDKAVAALPVVISEYLQDDALMYGGVSAKIKRTQLVESYCLQLSNMSVNGLVLRMGHARALGSLPKFVLLENLPTVISSLTDCTKVSDATVEWGEARRDAVLGLTEVCQTVGICCGVESYVTGIFETFLACLNEYTVDKRGDIGAWVREASMAGLLCMCRACAREAPHYASAEVVRRAVSGVAQQAVEKIDRTRALAANIFTSLIYNVPEVPNIPYHAELKRIFPPEEVQNAPKDTESIENGSAETEGLTVSESSSVVLWLFPGHTMPKFVQLLKYPIYRYSIILGLVVSGGDLTESLVKHATQSLYSYLNSLHGSASGREELRAVCDTIVSVFDDYQRVNRITVPIFNFLDRLLSSGSISPILEDSSSTFASNILKHVQLELRGCRNMYKLLDSINVLCQLIQVGGGVCVRALGQLAIYLCYADSYVRRCAATRAYEALLLYGDVSCVSPDNLDKVMSLLADTDWEKDVDELKPIRNELCDLMGIKRPVPKQPANKPKPT